MSLTVEHSDAQMPLVILTSQLVKYIYMQRQIDGYFAY